MYPWREKIGWLLLVATVAGVPRANAKIDLVTLPERESVQLTIYNSADLTLARDRRPLTLIRGDNRLQFSWSGTLIDPTSLDIMPRAHAGAIHVQEITYPPRVRNVGVWNIHSEIDGEAPMEIQFFTAGLSWNAYYIATLSADESTMQLDGYVTVANRSGEDYENAQVRLVVGEINLIDKIADLAQRPDPYGEPPVPPPVPRPAAALRSRAMDDAMIAMERAAPKEIVKEGLSEYFLYTIEGRETIPDGWSKRLRSFEAGAVPGMNLYKYEQERYGEDTMRFLHFKNDEAHRLGDTPLPDGRINVFRHAEDADHLHFLGADDTRYIPVGQNVELNLGIAREVRVEPTLMNFSKENFIFNNDGNIIGFDEVRTYETTVRNLSRRPAKLEIRRNIDTRFWQIENHAGPAAPETIDLDTFEYRLTLEPRTSATLSYDIRLYRGERENQR